MKNKLLIITVLTICFFSVHTYAKKTNLEKNLNQSNDVITIMDNHYEIGAFITPAEFDPYIDKNSSLYKNISVIKIEDQNYIRLSDLPKIINVQVSYKDPSLKMNPRGPVSSYVLNEPDSIYPGIMLTTNTDVIIIKDPYRHEKLVSVTHMLKNYNDPNLEYYFIDKNSNKEFDDTYNYYFVRKNGKKIIEKHFDVYSKNDGLYVMYEDFEEIIYPYLLEIFSQQ